MNNPFGSLAPTLHWTWQGASGAWYSHVVYPFSSGLALRDVNYILVKRDPDGMRHALYNGETDFTKTRFPAHEKFPRAILLGANEIHIHFGGDKQSRLRIETDLRRGHCPPLNDQELPAKPPVPAFPSSMDGLVNELAGTGPFDVPSFPLSGSYPPPRPQMLPLNSVFTGLAEFEPRSTTPLADALVAFLRKR